MYYSGKFFDVFEMAFSQMLEYYNFPQVPHIDCIGLRCFGFCMGNAIEEWFQPMISLPEALSALSVETKLELHSKKITCVDEFPDADGFILGPVKNGLTAPEARDYYYHGNGRYLFVRKSGNNEWEIFDPNGFAGLYIQKNRWDQLFTRATFCIWMNYRVKPVPVKNQSNILIRGLQYHDGIKKREYEDLRHACDTYIPGRKNALCLQYGLRNLILQMDKVFWLTASLDGLEPWQEFEYLAKKQALYTMSRQEEVFALPELVEEMWGILRNGM